MAIKTHKLKIKDYPTKTNFNLEAHIKTLVEREAWQFADIPAPQNPTYEKHTVLKNNVAWYMFFRQILP